MDDLEVHLGLIQRIIFSVLKAVRFFQDLISQFFWNIIAKPLIWVAWKWAGSRESDRFRRVLFKKEVLWLHGYGQFIKCIVAMNGWLSGLKSNFAIYDFLLSWNPSIPLIALNGKVDNKRKNYWIDWLGNESEIEPGLYALESSAVFGTSEISGHFFIVSKSFQQTAHSEIEINCVWISGQHRGTSFKIKKFGTSNLGPIPDHVYFPPKIFVWLFESIISLGVFVVLIGMFHKIWNFLNVGGVFKQISEAIRNYI